jgi:pantoate--beta-alanine ligase
MSTRFAVRAQTPMHTVSEVPELRSTIAAWCGAGQRMALVPTMGALHRGHLSLVETARSVAGRVVASIFVNPTQFGPEEDFARYPRDPAGDAGLLEQAGCDLLFLPAVETIYPPGHATFVEPGGAAEGLEGASRPGHFRGVATVVTQLFHLVQPHLAVFGEKDAQQLAVVRQLVRDLHFPVEIVAAPTVRETDGLALSSRNAYLSPEERRAAAVLWAALQAATRQIEAGEREPRRVRQRLRAVIGGEPLARLEYAEVVDEATFRPVGRIAGRVVLAVAVRIGEIRLIDNARMEIRA